MVAIVGATGAGKTTIFQLLNRFYEPWSGDLSVDGVALDRWAKRSLRSQVAYVMQEPYLFAGSIRDNLRMAAPDASDEAMWQALEQAHAAEFVRQRSGGLDAEVGERGGRLSGGERQRVALARAFLKDAPLLLLDEATSAVDAESERLIQQALRRLRRDRTCLVIAHRLSTILEADRICVLRDGGVMAQGRHEELLRTCPYYATLARMAGEAERRGSDTGAEV